jgi:hypothetical protein
MHDDIQVNIDYKFKIDTVGMKTIGDFIGVVCEIRYFLIGVINNKEKELYFVQGIDTSKLNKETFKSLPEVTKEDLLDWLLLSIEPENLLLRKQLVIEQFYPPITYLKPDYFKDSSGS